jgi:4-hydroxyphenylacetate 3-monooxygenase
MAGGDGTVDRMKGYAEQCMAEYDLDGWLVPDMIAPDDINLITRRG